MMEPNTEFNNENYDISKEWIESNPDLKAITQEFNLTDIQTQIEKRNFDSEFRILSRITETNKHLEKIVNYCPMKAA